MFLRPMFSALAMIFAVSAVPGTGLAEQPADASAISAQISAGGRTFLRYCALCHGIDATGSGPLADSLYKAPPDLTRLAERNGGSFPTAKVQEIIEKGGPKSHGMMAMLAWGKVFNDELGQDPNKVIGELAAYIETLQGR